MLFKFLKVAFPGIFCLLVLASAWPASVPAEDWREHAAERVARSRSTLYQFERSPDAEHFTALRADWEEISWLFRLNGQLTELERLDGHRAWVASPAAATYDYPEAGVLQQLEQRARTQVQSKVKASTKTLHDALSRLQAEIIHLDVPAGDLPFLLATELYRQYTLVLPGRQRIDRGQASADFRAFCSALPSWIAFTPLAGDATVRQRLTALQNHLDNAPSNLPRRLKLYTDYLRPLYQSLVAGSNVEKLAVTHGLAGHPNGRLFQHTWLDPLRPAEDTARIELGRLLFFDPLLSGNNKRSCASCHQPSKAFCDGRVTSQGFDFSQKLDRNAPSLVNTLATEVYFGHGLEHPTGEHFIQSVFDHEQEFRTTLPAVSERLSHYPAYRERFARSFPNQELDSANVLSALTAYVRSLRDTDSDFDRGIAPSRPAITADLVPEAVRRGYNLFHGTAGCATCHYPPFFSGLRPPEYQQREVQSIGLTHHAFGLTGHDPDLGYGATSGQERYNYFFRTPSLRNLAFSAPYGHNGAFIELSEVLDFLAKEPKQFPATVSMSVDTLSFAQQSDLLAFLQSLNGRIQQRENEDVLLPDFHEQHGRQRRRAAGLY